MKIYFIKVDTMPFRQEVWDLANMMGGSFARQVSGCFTGATLVPMLTGKLTSDLEPHGLGYKTWMNKKNKKGEIEFSWAKQYLQFYLLERGYNFTMRNYGGLLPQYGLDMYPEICGEHTTPYDQHDGHSQRYLIARGPEWEKSKKAEFAWIDKLQTSSDKNGFYLINYSHFHASVKRDPEEHREKCLVAGQNVLEILGHYDFSEPNALFWVFSDHGPWRHPAPDKYPFPYNFYTWSIVKDNTENPLVFPSKVISCQDFILYIKSKFESNISLPNSEKDRIFFSEDGRSELDSTKMTTAFACRFEQWGDGFPLRMICVYYNEIDNKFLERRVDFDDRGFEVTVHELTEVTYKDLKDALVQRISWIKNG